MGRYVNYADVVNRYPMIGKSGGEDQITSDFIRYAEFELEEKLGKKFSIPFSSNNMTAKDLSIDLTYLKFMRTTGNDFDFETLQASVNSRIAGLLKGDAFMAIESSDPLGKSEDSVYVGMNYKPVFGLGDELEFDVSSERLSFEENNYG